MATSNFIDTATIWLHAGKGGDGAVTFHREKFVAAGGPDGGDGGRGGDIIFVADDNLSTLMDFRYKRKYTAPDGENGRAKRMSGADGDDLVIRVPRGTVLKEAETDLVVADLTGSEPVVVAKGGRGGWGNSHFATPTRQIPKFAKPGLPGEDMHLKLELKVIADVGLIGFPNVGKSTLISIISAARPKIANYHFTTLTPVLGVVRVGPEQSFVCADIPGLIEGAAGGVGGGHACRGLGRRGRRSAAACCCTWWMSPAARAVTPRLILSRSTMSWQASAPSWPTARRLCWATSATLPPRSRSRSSRVISKPRA